MDGDSCNLNTVSHYAIPLASIALTLRQQAETDIWSFNERRIIVDF